MDASLLSNWVFLAIASCFLLGFLPCFRCINTLWWTPRRHRLVALKQGLHGPPPRLLLGNVMQIKALRESVPDALDSFRHDLTLQHLFPDHVLWTKLYGKRHLIWWGPDANIVTVEMDLLKEVLSSKYTITLGKPSLLQSFLEPVTGLGLVLTNGETWSHERRTIGPAFHFEKVKGFAEIMVKSTQKMLEDWNRIVKDGNGRAEIRIDESMTKLTAGIIAHTQFGSSYKRAKKIFEDLDKLTDFVFRYGHLLIIPGMRLLPTPAFLELKRIKRTVETSIREIIQDRKDSVEAGKSASYGADLLGLMLTESEKTGKDHEKNRPQLSMQQLVDECKTFFFAGHETTAQLLTWTLLLLAANTSWQDRARAEVVNVCKDKLPDSESAGRMKIVEMILFETLRLYAPANSIVRAALCDMKVGDLFIAKGMCFWIPIAAIHLDPELWGESVYEFNPERFAEGIGKAAKHPFAFLPFAYGPRNCVGQNFAMMEAKVVLATILPSFRFSISPNYKHSPHTMITVRPKHGAPILVERL